MFRWALAQNLASNKKEFGIGPNFQRVCPGKNLVLDKYIGSAGYANTAEIFHFKFFSLAIEKQFQNVQYVGWCLYWWEPSKNVVFDKCIDCFLDTLIRKYFISFNCWFANSLISSNRETISKSAICWLVVVWVGAIPPWQSPHPLPISCPNMTSPGSLCKGCSAGDDDDVMVMGSVMMAMMVIIS